MALYFSAAAGGFYDSDIHSTLPTDARQITAETHAALLGAQADGKVIAGNDNGDPVALTPLAPSEKEILIALRRRRDALLTASDWTQVPDAPFPAEQRAAWAAYRQALRDLPETTTDLAAVEWPAAPA